MSLTLTGPTVDAAAAWRLVGDSDHLNRMAGNPPLTFAIRPDDDGFPELHGEVLGPGPIRHRFTEVDLYWVAGQRFRQVRALDGPLLRRSTYDVSLVPDGEGVRPTITVDMEPVFGWLGGLTALLTERGLARWRRLLEALPQPGRPAEEPAVRPLTPDTQAALRRWRDRGGPGAVVDAVGALYTRARASELRELRPFALAERWGVAPRDLLVAFLEATQAGAMELYWSVRCPRCQGGVAAAQSLSNIADHASCASCRIGFAPDLEGSVEVLFAAPPGQRPPFEQQFCTLFPAGRPEVLAMMTLPPGAEERFTVTLPPGRCTLGVGGGQADHVLEVGGEGPGEWTWATTDSPGATSVRAGPVTFTLSNPGSRRVRVDLSVTRASRAGVSAAMLATMPEYRERFGPQVLADDVRIGVRAVAILFTDLTGSAALYHEHGDAAAFRFVHEHFAILETAVVANRGVRVKTIGDALMAAFHSPADALRAAMQMQAGFKGWVSSWAMQRPPGLKVGVHFGPAMAVHTDGAGLDYFGGTVNLAARAQGKATVGEIVWTDAVALDPEVVRALADAGMLASAFETVVKGLPDPVTLHRLG